MKKIFKFLLCSFLLAGSATAAAISVNRLVNKTVESAEASASNNYTVGSPYYWEKTDDPTNDIYWTASSNSPYTDSRLDESGTGNNISLTIGESQPSKKWHAMFVPVSYQCSVPAHSKNTYTFTYTFQTKNTHTESGNGHGDHAADFVYSGTHSITAATFHYSATPNDSPSLFYNGYAQTDLFVKRVIVKDGPGTATYNTNNTYSVTVDNSDGDSARAENIYFGLFGYIETQSSYYHLWSANLTLSASISSTTYVASSTLNSTTNYHTTFSGAMGAVSGSTINLFTNVTDTSSGYVLSKNLSILLNGYTITNSQEATCLFNVQSGYTLSITNGKIALSKMQMGVNVVNGATLTLSNVRLDSTDTGADRGYGVVVYGTFNLENSSQLNTVRYGVQMRNGATLNIKNSKFTGGVGTSIYATNNSSNKNYINIGGNSTSTSFSGKISIDSLSKTQLCKKCGGIAYTGAEISVEIRNADYTYEDVFFYGAANNSDASGVFSIVNYPDYMSYQFVGVGTADTWYVKLIAKLITLTPSFTNIKFANGSTTSTQFSATGDYETGIIPSNDKTYSLPATITLKRGSTTLSPSSSTYSYNSTTGAITIKQAAMIEYTFTITAVGVKTDYGYVQDFVTAYMHTEIPYTNNSNTGHCLGDTGYYHDAKEGFLALTSTQKTIFRTDEDFEKPLARYLAWAAANHDANPFDQTSGSNTINLIRNTSFVVYAIAIASICAVSLLGVAIVIRKKHH